MRSFFTSTLIQEPHFDLDHELHRLATCRSSERPRLGEAPHARDRYKTILLEDDLASVGDHSECGGGRELKLDEGERDEVTKRVSYDEKGKNWCTEVREAVRHALDDPQESRFGVNVQYAVLFLIMTSTVCVILETVRSYEVTYGGFFAYLEFVFTMFFTFEIVVRFWISDSMSGYFCSLSNFVDIVSTLPWYIEVCMQLRKTRWVRMAVHSDNVHLDTDSFQELRMVRMVRMIRLMRVLRLAKAARHMETISLVLESVERAYSGLLTLVAFTLMGTIFSATIIYNLECEEPDTPFSSIPAAMWWALPTITGVGYGDVLPNTVQGRVAAMITMICGMVITSVSAAMLTTTFMEKFKQQVEVLKMERAQKALLKRAATFRSSLSDSGGDSPKAVFMRSLTGALDIQNQIKELESKMEEVLEHLAAHAAARHPASSSLSYSVEGVKNCRVQAQALISHLRFLAKPVPEELEPGASPFCMGSGPDVVAPSLRALKSRLLLP